MPRFATVEKRVGETPLQALEAYRASRAELGDTPMAYAGRLDPMASGTLLLLIGEECKRADAYLNLDKEYEFEVLLGYESDSGDVLGMPRECAIGPDVNDKAAQQAGRRLIGTHELPYPAYSSKAVGGKALFQHAHDETLRDIEIPTRRMRVYRVDYLGSRTLSSTTLVKEIIADIEQLHVTPQPKVKGTDFRKGEILAAWKNRRLPGRTCVLLRYRAIVCSGTYIRSLAPLVARHLGTCGLARSIHRTALGRYYSPLGIGYWRPHFRHAQRRPAM